MKNVTHALLLMALTAMVTPMRSVADSGGGDDDHSSHSSSSSASLSGSSTSTSSGSGASESSDSSESEDSSNDSSRSRGNSSSSRSSGSSGNDDREIRRNSTLKTPSGVTSSVSGKSQYIDTKGEKRLHIRVQVPLGSTVPPLPSESSAQALSLIGQISRAGVLLASCQLEFRKVNSDSGRARYELEIRKKIRKSLREKFGSCTLADSSQPGLPAIKKGDSLSISETSVGTFLEGSF